MLSKRQRKWPLNSSEKRRSVEVKKMVIIPVFLPWMGCSNRCIYCNEKAITGCNYLNDKDPDILEKLDKLVMDHLAHIRGDGRVQIAFFGGSFSNAPYTVQESFLKWAHTYIQNGIVDSLRISTRPDGITGKEIDLFKQYHCESVELGVQSFSDEVLMKNNRGHDSKVAQEAINALISAKIETGVHLMTGLFGSTRKLDLDSFNKGLSLNPDSMRVHPTLVLKDTPLEQLFLKGNYKPLQLREAVEELGEFILLSRATRVKLNRIGLFIPNELVSSIVAGPYHPAIGDMAHIMAEILEVKALLLERGEVMVDKKTYDRFKAHRGFFNRYIQDE